MAGVSHLCSCQDLGWLPTWVLGSGAGGGRRGCEGYLVAGVSKGIYL